MSDYALDTMQRQEDADALAWQEEQGDGIAISGDGMVIEPTVHVPSPVRSLREILDDLAKPIPARLLKDKKKGGTTLTFCPWYHVVKILDHYTAGHWNYQITDKRIDAGNMLLTVRITIKSREGVIYREATGLETLDTNSYGDFSSNAESMALRRAASKFGLGLHLYNK